MSEGRSWDFSNLAVSRAVSRVRVSNINILDNPYKGLNSLWCNIKFKTGTAETHCENNGDT